MSLVHWGDELHEGKFQPSRVINLLVFHKEILLQCIFETIDVLIPGIYDFNMRHLFSTQLTLLYISCNEQENNVDYDLTEDVRNFLMSKSQSNFYQYFSGVSAVIINNDFYRRASWHVDLLLFFTFLTT